MPVPDAWPHLPPVPSGYRSSREDHHRLAYGVVAEARRLATGGLGLRQMPGGFGTPPFGADRQVRVDGTDLVVDEAGASRRAPITTLRAAGEHVGLTPGTAAAEHDSPPLGDLDAPLAVDATSSAFVAGWFRLAFAVLEELRTDQGAVAAGPVQLWPGHFDPATEIGDVDRGTRATYGASPGDAAEPEPYLYVGPWGSVGDDPFWNATSFSGAVLRYDALRSADDARTASLAFYREAMRRIDEAAG